MHAPELRVGDYVLRPPCADDFADLCAMMRSDAVRRFLGNKLFSESDQFARLGRNAGSWMLYGYGIFYARGLDGALAGIAGVFPTHRGLGPDFDGHPEAGWIIAEPYWGRGLATAFMQAALDWFDVVHGQQRIVAMIEQGHSASDRVAQKLAFAPYRMAQMGDDPVQLYERVLPATGA